jgi:hypothetical protein
MSIKTLKVIQLVGVVLLLLGVVIRVGGEIYGTHTAVLGVLLYAFGRIALWLKRD